MGAPNTTPDMRFVRHAEGGEWLGNIVGHYTTGEGEPKYIRTITCHTCLGSKTEAIANAHQMAASGALYDALEAICEEAGGMAMTMRRRAIFNAGLAALALARGEPQ